MTTKTDNWRPSLVIVGTGHRCERLGCSPDPMTWVPAIEHLVDLLCHVSVLAGDKLLVWSGMAEGFDLMLAAAALKARDKRKVGVRLGAAVPFAGDHLCFHNETAQRWHQNFVSRADYLPPGGAVSSVPYNYRARNEFLIRQPQHLGVPGVCWAAWDTQPRGGTFQTKNMAVAVGMPVDYTFLKVIREQLAIY